MRPGWGDQLGCRISGTIPAKMFPTAIELGLPSLPSIVLANCPKVSGTIPSTIASIGNIQTHTALVSGTLPLSILSPNSRNEFFEFSSCHVSGTISVADGNQELFRFYLPLPVQHAQPSVCNRFPLSSIGISGTVPSTIALNQNLANVMLDSLQALSGTLSDTFALLTKLSELSMRLNHVSGTLPNLNNHARFFVADNTRISGSIPSAWRGLGDLTILWLAESPISGSIPFDYNWGSLKYLVAYSCNLDGVVKKHPVDLQYVVLNNNRISGTLNDLTSTNIIMIDVQANSEISGSVPSAISSSPHLKAFLASGLSLSGIRTLTRTQHNFILRRDLLCCRFTSWQLTAFIFLPELRDAFGECAQRRLDQSPSS